MGYMLSTGPLRVRHNLATNQEQWEFSHRLPNKELLYLTNRCHLGTESQLWEFPSNERGSPASRHHGGHREWNPETASPRPQGSRGGGRGASRVHHNQTHLCSKQDEPGSLWKRSVS